MEIAGGGLLLRNTWSAIRDDVEATLTPKDWGNHTEKDWGFIIMQISTPANDETSSQSEWRRLDTAGCNDHFLEPLKS